MWLLEVEVGSRWFMWEANKDVERRGSFYLE